MDFTPVQIDYVTPQGVLIVTVTVEAIEMLWGADSGPQTGPEIVGHHRGMIEEAVQLKLADLMTMPTQLTITDEDLD